MLNSLYKISTIRWTILASTKVDRHGSFQFRLVIVIPEEITGGIPESTAEGISEGISGWTPEGSLERITGGTTGQILERISRENPPDGTPEEDLEGISGIILEEISARIQERILAWIPQWNPERNLNGISEGKSRKIFRVKSRKEIVEESKKKSCSHS